MSVDSLKWMHFRVYEFEVGVNDSIFCDNEQQKVYLAAKQSFFSWDMKVDVC